MKNHSFKLLLCMLVSSVSTSALAEETTLSIKGSVVSYIRSQDLSLANPEIEDAVIIVHGSERNAQVYYNSVVIAAQQLKREKQTLVLAPHFKTTEDALLPHELSFTYQGWLSGDPAENANISSFEVIDELISRLNNPSLFPNLKTITLTGHSAGGQLTQRYAAASLMEPENIHLRYVVANPGSYLYLTSRRLNAHSNTFEVPDILSCFHYNYYKFGLEHLNAYVGQSSKSEIIERYVERDITYLLGEKDTITEGLDNGCPEQLQGRTRLERGLNFKVSMDLFFPQNSHSLAKVPGVGHSQRAMYTSEVGKSVLFPKAPSPAPESKNRRSRHRDRL